MKLAIIEHHGSEGTTRSHLSAIARFYRAEERIDSVNLLSAQGIHGFCKKGENLRSLYHSQLINKSLKFVPRFALHRTRQSRVA